MKKETLDFKAYYGEFSPGNGAGRGKGLLTIDWNELHRMSKLLNRSEQTKASLRRGNVQANMDHLPTGQIRIAYNLLDDPSEYAVTFKDDFKFGSDVPFLRGHPTLIMRSAKHRENYLHMVSKKLDYINDKGPVDNVASCDHPWFGEIYNTHPAVQKTVKTIKKDKFLREPKKVHLELIWDDVAIGQDIPNNFLVKITGTGGPLYSWEFKGAGWL